MVSPVLAFGALLSKNTIKAHTLVPVGRLACLSLELEMPVLQSKPRHAVAAVATAAATAAVDENAHLCLGFQR